MNAEATQSGISKGRRYTGRAITGLVALFLLFDAITKVIKVPQVLAASAKIGFSAQSVVAIGVVLLACTAIFLIPRLAILGAVLLTGYLGGAVAVQVSNGQPLFSISFPIIFGVLIWAGLYLRDKRVRTVIPVEC
jgi:hypothetical protein